MSEWGCLRIPPDVWAMWQEVEKKCGPMLGLNMQSKADRVELFEHICRMLLEAPIEVLRKEQPQIGVLRRMVFQRDGHQCVECGSTYWLEMSHDIPRGRGGDDSMENCRCRCRKCHVKRDLHGQPHHF